MSEVIGPYRIERELGRGGMGVVYAGVHQELGRRAAIKVLLDPKLGGERFLRECEGMGRLDHPGIVRTYEAGTHQGCPYLAMELVEGKSLKDLLATTGPWPSRKAAELGVALCEAMAHVHEGGLLHRDLKPENILIDPAGQARITDFGLVRGVGGQSLTATGTMVGTPAFMPPEQAEGSKKQLGPPADVYGLGATLFAVLTGRPPFEGASPYAIVNQVFNTPAPAPSSLQPDVDPALEAVILRCLAKEPAARYADAAALGQELRSYLEGELSGTASGRGRLVFVVGLLLALAGALGGALAWRARSRPEEVASLDPQQIAADYRAARGDAGRVAKWLEDYADQADAGLVGRARRELASLSWANLSEVGATEEVPQVNDLSRLSAYRALVTWLREFEPHAKKSQVDDARERARLWRPGTPAPVLALLSGESRAPRKREALALSGGRVLGFGFKPLLFVSDLSSPPREVPFSLSEIEVPAPGEKTKPRFLKSATRVGDQILVVSGTELMSLDPATLEVRARLSLGPLRGNRVVPLPEGRALVVGELKGTGGGWTVIPPQPWPSEELPLTQREEASVRAGLYREGEVYLALGSSDASERDFFLHRYRYAEGGLELLDKVEQSSAGYDMRLLGGGRIVVGLNRKYAEVFKVGPLAEQAPIQLCLTQEERSMFAGLSVQCLGAIALSDGGVLLSCNSYGKEGASPQEGWLAYFEPEQIAEAKGALVYPLQLFPLPFSPRSLVESDDGSLIFVGTDNGYLAALPRFALR